MTFCVWYTARGEFYLPVGCPVREAITKTEKKEQDTDMEWMYRSTRDAQNRVTASQAVLKGLADDGGLYVPEQIPALDIPAEELAKDDVSGDRIRRYEPFSH